MTLSLKLTPQQRHDAIRSISRDPDISYAEVLRQIAELTPPAVDCERFTVRFRQTRRFLTSRDRHILGMTPEQWQARCEQAGIPCEKEA